MTKKQLFSLMGKWKRLTGEYPYALVQVRRDGFRLAILMRNNEKLIKEISKHES